MRRRIISGNSVGRPFAEGERGNRCDDRHRKGESDKSQGTN